MQKRQMRIPHHAADKYGLARYFHYLVIIEIIIVFITFGLHL
jgi:hypothetical protein